MDIKCLYIYVCIYIYMFCAHIHLRHIIVSPARFLEARAQVNLESLSEGRFDLICRVISSVLFTSHGIRRNSPAGFRV